MKESKQISEIDPESAVEASGIDPAIEEGIVAFDHHKPSALEALHTCPTLSTRMLKKSAGVAQRLNVRHGARFASLPAAALRDSLVEHPVLVPEPGYQAMMFYGCMRILPKEFSAACYVIEYDS